MKILHKKKFPSGKRTICFLSIPIFTYFQKKMVNKFDFIGKARQLGVRIGEDCQFTDMPNFGSEPIFIEIGNHVLLSFGICFVTHDSSTYACHSFFKDPKKVHNKLGKIKVGNDVFIGCNTTILPGCTIGNKCVVGACSLVTKDIPDGEVWAGNPAHFITTTEKLAKKIEQNSQTEFQQKLFQEQAAFKQQLLEKELKKSQ